VEGEGEKEIDDKEEDYLRAVFDVQLGRM